MSLGEDDRLVYDDYAEACEEAEGGEPWVFDASDAAPVETRAEEVYEVLHWGRRYTFTLEPLEATGCTLEESEAGLFVHLFDLAEALGADLVAAPHLEGLVNIAHPDAQRALTPGGLREPGRAGRTAQVEGGGEDEALADWWDDDEAMHRAPGVVPGWNETPPEGAEPGYAPPKRYVYTDVGARDRSDLDRDDADDDDSRGRGRGKRQVFDDEDEDARGDLSGVMYRQLLRARDHEAELDELAEGDLGEEVEFDEFGLVEQWPARVLADVMGGARDVDSIKEERKAYAASYTEEDALVPDLENTPPPLDKDGFGREMPPGIRKDGGADNIRAVLALATPHELAYWGNWYYIAHRECKEGVEQLASEGIDVDFETFVGVVAALSPNLKWEMNVTAALNLVRNPGYFRNAVLQRLRKNAPILAEQQRHATPFSAVVKKFHAERVAPFAAQRELLRSAVKTKMETVVVKGKKVRRPKKVTLQDIRSGEYGVRLQQRLLKLDAPATHAQSARLIDREPEYQYPLEELLRDYPSEYANRWVTKVTTKYYDAVEEKFVARANPVPAPSTVGASQAKKFVEAHYAQRRKTEVNEHYPFFGVPQYAANILKGLDILTEGARVFSRRDPVDQLQPLTWEKAKMWEPEGEVEGRRWVTHDASRVGKRVPVPDDANLVGPKVALFFDAMRDPEEASGSVVLDGHAINIWRGDWWTALTDVSASASEKDTMVADYVAVAEEQDPPRTAQAVQAITWSLWRPLINQLRAQEKAEEKAAEEERKQRRREQREQRRKKTSAHARARAPAPALTWFSLRGRSTRPGVGQRS
jgi:hypothetical protein